MGLQNTRLMNASQKQLSKDFHRDFVVQTNKLNDLALKSKKNAAQIQQKAKLQEAVMQMKAQAAKPLPKQTVFEAKLTFMPVLAESTRHVGSKPQKVESQRIFTVSDRLHSLKDASSIIERETNLQHLNLNASSFLNQDRDAVNTAHS